MGKQITLFSTYPSRRRPRDLYNGVKIWEAARATSAATSFFDSVEILGEEFVDGAFGANNPTNEMWTEAGDIWMDEADSKLEDKVGCIVSIGTGMPAFEAIDETLKGIFDTLKSIATDCERTAEIFRRQHRALEGRFFRFNVPQGLEDVGLEEATKTREIKAATRHYLELQTTMREVDAFHLVILQRQSM